MRRLLAALAVLSSLAPLFSEGGRKSNALGQDLGPEEEGDEWILDAEGNLLHNGVAAEKLSGSERTYDEQGRLTREAEGSRVTDYSYDGKGRLSRIRVTDGGKLSLISWYFYGPDGTLSLAQSTGGPENWFYGRDGSFAYGDGKTYSSYGQSGGHWFLLTSWDGEEGLMPDQNVSFDPEGRVRLARENVTEVYDANGNIIEQDFGPERKIYSTWREDGSLASRKEERPGGEETLTEYDENGNMFRVTETKDGTVEKITEYGEEVKETVYRNGTPYAVVTYESPGGKVKGVSYL